MPLLSSTSKLKSKMENSNKTDSRKIDFDRIKSSVVEFFSTHFSKISAETMGWLAAIALHAATIPSLLALLTGMTDTTPSVDVVLLMWLSNNREGLY